MAHRLVGDVFYKYKASSSLLIKPAASVVWQSDDYNDYYYGVRSRAVNASPYTADSDINYRLGVLGSLPATGFTLDVHGWFAL